MRKNIQNTIYGHLCMFILPPTQKIKICGHHLKAKMDTFKMVKKNFSLYESPAKIPLYKAYSKNVQYRPKYKTFKAPKYRPKPPKSK